MSSGKAASRPSARSTGAASGEGARGGSRIACKPIAPEEIYEALFDDEQFHALPRRLAEALGGRSVVVHWHYGDGSADVLAHSGYFTAEQLALYASDFAALDPWAAASAGRQQEGRAINLETLVSPAEYERSRFYNDYIRGIGDDTFRCMGLRSNTRWGSGMIAVQGGRSQPSFDADQVASLERYAVHLRRMLILRGRIASLQRRASTYEAILDSMRDAAFLVAPDGRLIRANAAGEDYILSGRGIALHGGIIGVEGRGDARQLRNAIHRACDREPSASCISIDRGSFPPLIVTVAPVGDPSGGRLALLTLSAASPGPAVHEALRRLFGLTASEAGIAARIAEGLTPVEIAEERAVSLSTIRAQVKSLFAKIGCSRQAELVILVKSIALR